MMFMSTRTAPDHPELPLTEEFGRRVVTARKAAKLSQWALARSVKPPTTQATISAIERGVGQSSWVIPVCRVLKIDPPIAGEPDGMERWISVGRLLLARAPKTFDYLGAIEHIADEIVSLAQAKEVAVTPETPRRH